MTDMPEFHSDAADKAGEKLSPFVAAYIEAAYFTSTGDNDEPNSEAELSVQGRDLAISDCTEFVLLAHAHLDEVYANFPYDEASAGRDFWYTRNGHGVGFWDRDLGDLGDVLSELARQFGPCDLYAGDDGLLHLA
jgi:hypothetical protein